MDDDRPAPLWVNCRRRVVIGLALAVVAAVPFLPTLGNGFAGWDDTVNFLANRAFRGLGVDNLRWAWTTYLMGVYQPLGWIIYEAEYAAWGLEPRWYHLVSIVFHAANALALWALICSILGPIGRDADGPAVDDQAALASAAAVALFAVHPLRVEAVAWASCQSYLPGSFFGIASVIVYLRAFEPGATDGRPDRVVAAWVLFAVALLTKVAVIGLPFVLLILDVYPLRRVGPGRWLSFGALKVYGEKLAFLTLAVPFMVAAIQARWPTGQRPVVGPADLLTRLAQSAYGIWFYPVKSVFPFGLASMYPLPARTLDYARWPFVAAAAATLLVCVSAWRGRRRFPGLVAAWCSYLVCLAPSLGLIRTSQNLAADRYSYVPSMAGVVALAFALTRLGSLPKARRFVPIVLALLIFGLSALSWRQSLTWRSTETLWAGFGVSGRPHHDAQVRAGIEKKRRGLPEEASYHFLQALTDFPGSVHALQNLAEVDFQQGKLDEAEEMWTRLLAVRPESAEAVKGLATVRAGRREGRARTITPEAP